MNIKLVITLFLTLLSTFSAAISLAAPPATVVAQLASLSKTNNTLTYIKSAHLSGTGDLLKVNIMNGQILKRISFNVDRKLSPFAATPDGFKFLAKSASGIAVIHNGTGKTLRTLPYPDGTRDWSITPVLSSNTVYLAIASKTQHIYFIHTGTGKILRHIDLNKLSDTNKSTVISAMGFSPDNKTFAYQTETNLKSTLHIYDINNQRELASIQLADTTKYDSVHTNRNVLKFNGIGTQLISYTSGSANQNIQLIDLNSHTTQILNLGKFTFAGFAKNSRSIITINPIERIITQFDIQTGKRKKIPLAVHKMTGTPSGLTQSTDKSIIVMPFISQSKSNDSFLIIDSNTGNIIRTLNNNSQ